jgi:endonuclease/exonuclease/phosphatase family metal-dependent hydrolase
MSTSLRIASFNVENLFARPKVLNLKDQSVGNTILELINELQQLLKKAVYTDEVKKRILELYKGELKPYIDVREERGKLFQRKGYAVTGVKADGAGDWDGAIEFKRAKFSELTRKNTAKVINDVLADVFCIVEAEDRSSLQSFSSELLKKKFPYSMLIDANDPRGIDIGLYSRYPLGEIRTHMFDKENKKTIFSRDCLEVEILLPDGQSLHMLCNHFKSKGYDIDGNASGKRERQARRVAQILERFDLDKDWVVVAGDFNDYPDSLPLKPLINVKNLYDVLALQYPDHPSKRWTYHYKKFEQIDFLLVSKPLKERFSKAGVERRGIANLKKMTTSSNGLVDVETEYNTVTNWANSASDHGAVWADFNLG